MSARKVLVAGIGNIFLGDDAFGVEVVRRLSAQPWRDGVRVTDFGIRGLALVYALLDGYDAAVLVDATARGRAPGTLYVLEPELGEAASAPVSPVIDAHELNPMKVLEVARSMGATPKQLRLVGCEPLSLGSLDEPAMGLSDPVANAVPQAMQMVISLVDELLEVAHA